MCLMNPTFLLVTDCRPSPPVIFDHQGFTLLGHCRVSFVLLKLLASSIFRWWTWRFKTMFVKFSLINVWESALIMSVWSVTVSETRLIACPSPTFNIITDQTIKFSSFKRRSLQEVSRRSPGGEHIYYLLQMLSYCKVVSESCGWEGKLARLNL